MFSLVIQAGGKSSRMGSNKALLRLNGKTLIELLINRFSGYTDDLIVISPQLSAVVGYGYPVYSDLVPDVGPLMGLYTGLYYAKHNFVAVIACDMPFANPTLVLEEVRLLSGSKYDVVIPFAAGKYEPLHAVYNRETCLEAINRGLLTGMQRLIGWHSGMDVYIMGKKEIDLFDPEGLAFFNINTPGDIKIAGELIRESEHGEM